MVANNTILLLHTYAVHSKEYSPGFAQLRDLLHSCVR